MKGSIRAGLSALAALAAATAAGADGPTHPTPGHAAPRAALKIALSIDFPPDGAELHATACGGFVAGRALASRETLRRFDIAMVIDTSRSTADPSGRDVDGDGQIGRSRGGALGRLFGVGSSDRGDSVLAAEVAAARRVLEGLDPRSTRVTLLAFAGEQAGANGRFATRRAALTLEALTRDYRRIERGLDELLASDPEGNTHMAAGVDQATIELLGLRDAYSKPDPESEKIVFFFTDGQPTLPYGPDAEADNVRAVLRAANRARRAGIRIHSFAIGPEALAGPIAPVELAERTGGNFTPVRDPGDLVSAVEELHFVEVDQVRLEHAATGARAHPFRVTADGSWAGFLPLEPGANAIRASAHAAGGRSAVREIRVTRAGANTSEPALPPALLPLRNRLLEDCLVETRAQREESERADVEKWRRALLIEIEREREAARERADAQRKRLELGSEAD